jgi:hypothetical protein
MTDRFAAAVAAMDSDELFATAGPLSDIGELLRGEAKVAVFCSNIPEDPPRADPTMVGNDRAIEFWEALLDLVAAELTDRTQV